MNGRTQTKVPKRGEVQHLPLGGPYVPGPGHAGLFVDCATCAAYLKAHPKTPVPSAAPTATTTRTRQ